MSQYNSRQFDETLQNPEINALKAVLPYMKPSIGKMAAIFIKMLEIKTVMETFESTIAIPTAETERSARMLAALRSNCDERTAGYIDFMQKAQEMRKMADMLNAYGFYSRQEE